MHTYTSLAARLEANSTPAACGCRLWTGNLNNSGYPRFSKRAGQKVTKVYAHRAAWEIEFDQPIPAGLELDHLCNDTTCINPHHLEPVTGAENIARRDARRAAAH